MNVQEFTEMSEYVFDQCRKVLLDKGLVRNDEEARQRLAQFYRIAKMRDCTLVEAVTRAGMDKHLTIIYELINKANNDNVRNISAWDSSILDAINYLVLLRACVIETLNIMDPLKDETSFDPNAGQTIPVMKGVLNSLTRGTYPPATEDPS